MKIRNLLVALAFIVPVASAMGADDAELAKHLLASKAGVSGGICALPRCGGELAVAVARSGNFLVHAQDPRPSVVAAARDAADRAGLLGRKVIVEKGTPSRLPYADNTVDLVLMTDLADEGLGDVSAREVLRALRPRGKAVLGRTASAGADALTPQRLEKWLKDAGVAGAAVSRDSHGLWAVITKPPLAGADDWSHWVHGPDNNPVSKDTVIKAPYMTQWLGKPYYMAMPVVTTVAAGRIFVASGHIAHHDREIPTLRTLCARNGYNGAVLWKRKLPEGYLVHRSAFIATEDVFYMIDGNGCLMLDPETGEEKGRIRIPGVNGEWKWMALRDGVMFVLAGEKDPAAETTLVSSGHDHWSWRSLSRGYYAKPRIPWGFATTVAAYDLKKQERLWTHTEPKPIDSRGMGICGSRLFFYAPDSRIGCLDAASGKLLWTSADKQTLELIEQPGKGLKSTPGFRTTHIMLCTPRILFFEAQTRMNVVAVSAEDGHFLWKRTKSRNNPNLLFIDGRLVIAGIGQRGTTQIVDPMTGETIKDLNFSKVTCTRMTACPDALFCRGEGLGRYDRARGVYVVDGSARPGCNDGAIPANGLLYVGPWLCDCNLSLIGTMVLCSAGDFRFDVAATEAERLESGEGDALNVADIGSNEYDWPTYRGNNHRTASSKAAVPADPAKLWEFKPEAGNHPSPPTSAGNLVFVCGDDGVVRCVDGRTGKLRWRFVTAGPVRLPPSIWQNRAFVGSGDGYVYALEAATGRLLWRFRAAPVERRIMVYGSLCSTWPVNSGVLVADGVAYFAAGIIDRDGTYVYAVNAKTGKIKWQNNESGHLNKEIRKGVSVQGDLTIGQGRLWMASGNQVSPASYDLEAGRCRIDAVPPGRPISNRGCEVAMFRNRYVVRGGRLLYSADSPVVSSALFGFLEVKDGGRIQGPDVCRSMRSCIPPAWDEDIIAFLTDRYGHMVCWDAAEFEKRLAWLKQQYRRINREVSWPQRRRAMYSLAQELRKTGKWRLQGRNAVALAVAANAVVAVCDNRPDKGWVVCALDKKDGRTLWERALPSQPVLNGLLVDRNGCVIVALKDGTLVCFGRRG